MNSLALGFRPALRAALDVDSWLREHPRSSNPTALICARYWSILERIVAPVATHPGYDDLIIVSHSQGTVITADFLRYLKKATHSSFAKNITIHLLTFGCPLRQLYHVRFPYLYDWVDAVPGGGPDPKSLGVATWINLYRSGDYVGRYLWGCGVNRWTSHWHPIQGEPSVYRERCIGPGAHTHYTDHTAAEVAEELDELISRCLQSRNQPVLYAGRDAPPQKTQSQISP